MSQTLASRLNILAVENEDRVSKLKGTTYRHFVARAVVMADDGTVITVGALRSSQVLPALRDTVKVGSFRCGFSVMVPDWGDDKGDIVSILTELTPDVVRAPSVPSASSVAKVPA